MTTTLPLIVPSLTPTSSPTRKSSGYNDSSLLSLNNNQNTTPISSLLNTSKAPITPDSCSSSSFTNKLPKIKLILKLPSSSNSPKERTNKNASPILHKPINITSSASSPNLINNNSINSSSQAVLMIDKIKYTIFNRNEILLKNKINDNSQHGSPKSKEKSLKLRKVRTTSNKIKKSPVKNSPTKKTTRKKQAMEISEEIKTNDNTISPMNTIESNTFSEIELKSKNENENGNENKLNSSLAISNKDPFVNNIHSSLKSLEDNDHSIPIESSSNQTFKLKKIKFIYKPNNDKTNESKSEEEKDDENIENGKRKRKSGIQKSTSPKKRREGTKQSNTNSNSINITKNLFSNKKETSASPNHPIIHLKVSNNNENNEITNDNMDIESKQVQKKKGRKRALPTKKQPKSTAKTKKDNVTFIPVSQKSPPQRSPKQQPQTKSYQMSKLDHKFVNDSNNNTTSLSTSSSSSSSSASKQTFKLNLSYAPSYISSNDNTRYNSYLSSFKHKSSYVHSPSPLTNSFTYDQVQNGTISNNTNNGYVQSKLAISTIYDPNNCKIKTKISPTNQILNNNLWKSKNVKYNTTTTTTSNDNKNNKNKKEKISIIDVLKRESQLFTSSSKKYHSKSSVSSYYGRSSLRRFSSFVDEAAKVKSISIQSNNSDTFSIISTPTTTRYKSKSKSKSIITSPYYEDASKYRPSLNSNNNNINSSSEIKNKDKTYPPNNRIKSFSTPASPKNLSEDSLRSKAHSYIQRSLTSCQSLTEKFEFYSILGYGSNGVVLGAKRRSDGLDVAIKYIYKTPTSRICEEVNILREVSPHPSIIRYIDSFEDNNCIYLVTEKSGSSWVPSEDSNQILTCESPSTGRIVLNSLTCNTSSLFDYIELNGCVPPPEQKRMFKAIAEAVYALHTNNIVHGDIKEENILIDSHHNPKLCDFGHARHIDSHSPPHFAVYGTLELSAPELMPNLNVPAHLTKTHVVKRYNGMAQDIWALGLVLYTMTHGELPSNHSKVISKEIDLTSGKYKEYPCYYSRNLSKNCIHLIRRMLTVDMKKRATIQEIINHPWLKK
jgi:hypothetical protein